MTRDQKNRKIAEALGWIGVFVPDFYTSAEDNALIVTHCATKEWEIEIYWTFKTKWSCAFMRVAAAEAYRAYDPDLMTAICESYLAMLEAGQ